VSASAKAGLSFAQIENIVLALKEVGLRWVYICGLGEPRQDPSFFRVLELFARHQISTSIFTNGLAFKREDVSTMKEFKPNLLVSLDSFNEEHFNAVMNSPWRKRSAARQVYDFVGWLLEDGFVRPNVHGETNVGLSIVPTKITLSDIPEVVEYCQANQLYPAIGEMEKAGRAIENYEILAVTDSELRELKRQLRPILGYSYRRRLCPGIFTGLHIINKGSIVIDPQTGLSCCWFEQTDPKYLRIGRGTRNTFLHINQDIIRIRYEQLDDTVTKLKPFTPVLAAGGGDTPSSWVAGYRKVILRLAKRFGFTSGS
jgi:MoaA/NifB/PqqE/SkfB family radical SAM enzyme